MRPASHYAYSSPTFKLPNAREHSLPGLEVLRYEWSIYHLQCVDPPFLVVWGCVVCGVRLYVVMIVIRVVTIGYNVEKTCSK